MIKCHKFVKNKNYENLNEFHGIAKIENEIRWAGVDIQFMNNFINNGTESYLWIRSSSTK